MAASQLEASGMEADVEATMIKLQVFIRQRPRLPGVQLRA